MTLYRNLLKVESMQAGSLDLKKALSLPPLEAVNLALQTAELKLNIPALLEAEDTVSNPDANSIMLYLSFFRDFANEHFPEGESEETEEEKEMRAAAQRAAVEAEEAEEQKVQEEKRKKAEDEQYRIELEQKEAEQKKFEEEKEAEDERLRIEEEAAEAKQKEVEEAERVAELLKRQQSEAVKSQAAARKEELKKLRAQDSKDRKGPEENEDGSFSMPDGRRIIAPHGRIDRGVVKMSFFYDAKANKLKVAPLCENQNLGLSFFDSFRCFYKCRLEFSKLAVSFQWIPTAFLIHTSKFI